MGGWEAIKCSQPTSFYPFVIPPTSFFLFRSSLNFVGAGGSWRSQWEIGDGVFGKGGDSGRGWPQYLEATPRADRVDQLEVVPRAGEGFLPPARGSASGCMGGPPSNSRHCFKLGESGVPRAAWGGGGGPSLRLEAVPRAGGESLALLQLEVVPRAGSPAQGTASSWGGEGWPFRLTSFFFCLFWYWLGTTISFSRFEKVAFTGAGGDLPSYIEGYSPDHIAAIMGLPKCPSHDSLEDLDELSDIEVNNSIGSGPDDRVEEVTSGSEGRGACVE
ncbi:UNVERIFIED_CONTAM: hypothetical protein Sangu_0988300 [Sesamum angustifolium]|uniref:Uncharacterized protein n=1 Tax=Sesamum angustifolium TaxID=2727405 RepID=A0AAW2PG09_9LAMI